MLDPVLFLIPARAGSKRLPGKNLRLLAGIPLVGWAARRARRAAVRLAGATCRIVCSSDDASIAKAAGRYGAEALARPPELARDDTPSVEVALHALDALRPTKFRTLVLLQPTSPLATEADTLATLAAVERGAKSAATVSPAPPRSVSFLVRRSWLEAPPETPAPGGEPVVVNGACYAVEVEELRRTRRFLTSGASAAVAMPAERGFDIDTEADLALCRSVLQARRPRGIEIAGRPIGEGQRCFVIAEAGVNHNGDLALAHRLVDAAADAGADAVKFQSFVAARLATAGAPLAAYQQPGQAGRSQLELLGDLELSPAAHGELQRHARERGVVFLSSPFDEASVDLLDGLGVPALKIASGEVTNHGLLRHAATKGRPILLSTGMSELWEVAAAVDALAAHPELPLALLHCVSQYPAPTAQLNLRAARTLEQAFGVTCGFSDHSSEPYAALAAVAAGASLVERHLTLDRALPGPDHRASSEPAEFRDLVSQLRAVEAALGSAEKRPTDGEREVAAVARRSLHWRLALEAGALVHASDLVALRPGTGLPPYELETVVGRRLRTAVQAGSLVRRDQLEA